MLIGYFGFVMSEDRAEAQSYAEWLHQYEKDKRSVAALPELERKSKFSVRSSQAKTQLNPLTGLVSSSHLSVS